MHKLKNNSCLLTLIAAMVCIVNPSWVLAQDPRSVIEQYLNQFEGAANPQNQAQVSPNLPFPTPAPSDSSGPFGQFPVQPNDPFAVQTQPSSTTDPAESTEASEPHADVVISEPNGTDTMIDVLDLKDMDVHDFLRFISQKSGLNIVATPNVRAKITIYLKNVSVRDALHIVLESNDLAYVEEEDIIKVMPGKDFEIKYGFKFGDNMQTKIIKLTYANVLDMVTVLNQMKSLTGRVVFDHKSNTIVLIDTPEKMVGMEALIRQIDVPIETEIFDLSYADAKEVSEKLGESLTLNVGRIKFDERSNRIIVTDTPAKVKEIDRIISAFDVKEEVVLIEAKIVQILLSDEHKMGIDWEAIISDYHKLNLKSNLTAFASTDKKGTLSIGTLSSDDYKVLIEALDTIGTTNILSSPSITTVNNKEAKILVGSTQPYVTTTTTTPSSGPPTTAETVNFIEVGVKLYVTPVIHHDRFITMKIKPEVSSVTSTLTTSNNNQIPIVETSEAETTVTVKDGVTIVIGGLIKEELLDSVKKVPLLGDIPLLGIAFRNQNKTVKKTELVIFLTPRIITGDVPSDRLSTDR